MGYGFNEGGLGRLDKFLIGRASGKIGGDVGDKFANSLAFPGSKTEMILRMMPLISGSVRIIRSVFNKLLESLPSGQDGPLTTKTKISQTVENMFGFMKSIQSGSVTLDELDSMSGNDIEALISTFNFSDDERKQIDAVIDTVTEPLNALIGKDVSGEVSKPSQDLAEFSDEELEAIAGGQ